ncbi:MAG: hypothetical protein Q4C98_02425 [Capnocytophaga sp.]|nr:hypothetical protein [Capnocytophaga sp.]
MNEPLLTSEVINIKSKRQNAVDYFKRNLNLKNIPKNGKLTISEDKIFKISDEGTDDIYRVTIEKITKTN